MKPELPAPQFTPEQASVNPEQAGEYGQQLLNPEIAGERRSEREQYMRSADTQAAPPPPPVVPAIPMPMPVPAQSTQQPADDTPAVAGDDDLIEKEWVDRAKKIIAETKDDPYLREREINRLQIDYLRKRYGKELGSAD